ncbi:MAG: hypothetical protein ACI8RD_001078 [Bacillariaceae sp.]|jgi:hypothetical protein
MPSLQNRRDALIFHYCSNALERVSIRNVKWGITDFDCNLNVVPRSALIKFVPNAPMSLRWFRSDLTHANMNVLRLERPGIELFN